MMKYILILTLGLSLAVQAADVPQVERVFNANEFGLSLGGTVSDESLGVDNDETWGFGVAANYFAFQKYVGLQVGTTLRNFEGSFLDDVEMDMILRLPFDKLRIAPYVVGGGAYRFEQENWDTSVGPGVQYRFTEKWGVFGEYRYHFDREALGQEVNEWRFGLNLVF